MAEINEEDIISKKALESPIELANNIDKAVESLMKLINAGKQANVNLTMADSTKKLNKELSDLELREKELTSVSSRLAKAQAQNNDEFIKKQAELKKVQREVRENIKQEEKLDDAYLEQSRTLNKLRAEYKSVAIQHGLNSKEAKALRGEVNRLDANLKKVDASAGQYQRSVGNYGKALQGFKNIIGQLGVVAGAAAIVQGIKAIIKTNKDFEKSLSSLSSITGATGDDLLFFSDEAKRMGSTTTQTASEVVKAFEIIGSKKPELLQSKEALAQVTEEAIALAEASGMTVPEAAEALTGAMNQFGAGAEEASKFINALAAGSKEGAAGITDISEAIRVSGTVLSSANVSFERSVGLIETLAEKQITASQAGTNLRNITLKLQNDQKNYVNGVFDMNFALERLNKEQLTSTQLTKEFGLENVTAAKILIDGIETTDRYTKAVTGTSVAYEQQKTNTDNLQGSLQAFNSKVEALILSFDGDGGLTYVIRKAIDATGEFIDMITKLNTTRDAFDRQERAEVLKSNQIQVVQQLNEGFSKLLATGKEMSQADFGNAEIANYLNNIKVVNEELFQKRARLEEIERMTSANSGREALQIIQERKELEKQIPKLNERVEIYNQSIGIVEKWINQKTKEKTVVDDTTKSISSYAETMAKVAGIDFSNLDPIQFSNMEEAVKQYNSELDEAIRKQNEFNAMLNEINNMENPLEETSYLDQLEMIRQKEMMTTTERINHYKTLQNSLVENTNLTEEQKLRLHQDYESQITQIIEDENQKRLDKQLETFNAIAFGISESSQIAYDAFTANNQAMMEQNELRLDRLQERRENELELFEGNEAKQQEIRARFDAEQAQLEKQQAARKRKQAIADKALAISQAIISTAVAATQALYNIPLSILIGFLGAAKVAVIASTPIPQFKDGVENFEGGLAVVNDGNGQELIKEGNQMSMIYSKGSALTYLKKGAQVFTAEETEKMLNGTVKGSIGLDQPNNPYKDERIIGALNGLRSDMKKQKQLHVNISKRSVEMSIRNGQNIVKLLNSDFK